MAKMVILAMTMMMLNMTMSIFVSRATTMLTVPLSMTMQMVILPKTTWYKTVYAHA